MGTKDQLAGTVKFVFQFAEGGPSLYAAFTGKSWSAKAMIKEGVLQNPRPDACPAFMSNPGCQRHRRTRHAGRRDRLGVCSSRPGNKDIPSCMRSNS